MDETKETKDEKRVPWYNKLKMSVEYFNENAPWTVGKLNQLFGDIVPGYPVKGFLIGYETIEDRDKELLSVWLHFTDRWFLVAHIDDRVSKKYPNLERFVMMKTLKEHARLNAHMKDLPVKDLNMTIGWNNDDDFIQDRKSIRFDYTFA